MTLPVSSLLAFDDLLEHGQSIRTNVLNVKLKITKTQPPNPTSPHNSSVPTATQTPPFNPLPQSFSKRLPQPPHHRISHLHHRIQQHLDVQTNLGKPGNDLRAENANSGQGASSVNALLQDQMTDLR